MGRDDSEWEDYGIVTFAQIHPLLSVLDSCARGRGKGAASREVA